MWGDTALHEASMLSLGHVVRTLLAAGASVHARNKDQRTPLQAAAARGVAAIVRVLLHEGRARMSLATQPCTWRACWAMWRLPVPWLPPAQTSTRAQKAGVPPMHGAAQEGSAAVIRMLVHYAGARLEDKDYGGMTALHTAFGHGYLDAVASLADLHTKKNNG